MEEVNGNTDDAAKPTLKVIIKYESGILLFFQFKDCRLCILMIGLNCLIFWRRASCCNIFRTLPSAAMNYKAIGALILASFQI